MDPAQINLCLHSLSKMLKKTFNLMKRIKQQLLAVAQWSTILQLGSANNDNVNNNRII